MTNNTVSNTFLGGGAILYNSHNNSITNSTMSWSEHGAGIAMGLSNDNLLSENTIFSNDDDGVSIHSSKSITIANNHVFDNSGTGIHLWLSEDSFVANNNVTYNRYGIRLTESHWNIVANNNASSSLFGVHVSGSDWNRITNNNVSLNQWSGVTLEFLNTNNTISYNTIFSNGEYGLSLELAYQNTIYHNNIISNAQQAFDDTDANQWDNGYPSGGNYWSDYTGVDQFSGPSQNVSGSDEIGDTPYVIDPDSRDMYPLMSPFIGNMSRPPVNLRAFLSGSGHSDVSIGWSISPDDGMGFRTVTGYNVYRNSTYDSEGIGYSLIASLPSGSTEFIDGLAGEGDANDYFYRICSVNLTLNVSCAYDQAGKFTRPLMEGPNIVSIPLVQYDEDIQTVLQTVEFQESWSYDSVNQEWESFMKSKPYPGNLKSINHRTGLWVNVTRASNLTVAGVVPLQTSISLTAGWNLVAFPSFDANYLVSDLNSTLPLDRIEGFDASSPTYYLRALQGSDKLEAGHGYWIRVALDVDWILFNT
jgi:parallel beta-helix repeat protein